MNEKPIVKEIRLALARKYKARLFVNTVGKAWFGKFVKMKDGELTLMGARVKDIGLGDGSPDLIGWITVDFGFGPVAVFFAIEVKKPGEKPRPDQLNWQRVLKEAGALVGVATSPEEAIALVEAYILEKHL